MNIININSSIEITPSQKSFIEEVLDSEDNPHMREEDSFYMLSKTVPIFLINEESMKKNDPIDESKDRYEPSNEIKPHTEWLGFYGRDSNGLFEQTPVIAICPERIAQCVPSDEEFLFLLAKVIVHEFAHAKMDAKNQNKKYKTKDTFWKWMEESSANRYTLEVFRNFNCRYRTSKYKTFSNKTYEERLWDFIVDFVKHQPPEYALGYELFEKRPVQVWEWEREKSYLGGKKRAPEKTDWLKYVTKNYSKIDNNKISFLFEAIFNGNKEALQETAKQKLKEKILNNDPDITQKDIANITDMSSLFHGVTELKADISTWNVSHVTDMSHMFKYSTFKPDLSNWDVSNVNDMRLMFCDAEFHGDLSKWEISKSVCLIDFGIYKINSYDNFEKYKLTRKKLGRFARLLRD